MFRVIAFIAVAVGMIIASWYLNSLKRFITVIRKREKNLWEMLGQPLGISDISPLRNTRLIKTILKGRLISPEAETIRRTAKKRLLILIWYFVVISLGLFLGGVLIGIFESGVY